VSKAGNSATGGVLGFRRVMERAEFTGGGITLHLPVPIVVLERMAAVNSAWGATTVVMVDLPDMTVKK
jgi:hypothetical protein